MTGRVITALAAVLVVAACSGAADVADAGDALPILVTAKEPQEAWLSNLGRGPLVLDAAGCLRHGAAFVIWPAGSQVARLPDGRVQVIDGANGKAVHVGEDIGMSGVEGPEAPEAARISQAIPEACAAGSFKWGGLVVPPSELQAIDDQRAGRQPVPAPQ